MHTVFQSVSSLHNGKKHIENISTFEGTVEDNLNNAFEVLADKATKVKEVVKQHQPDLYAILYEDDNPILAANIKKTAKIQRENGTVRILFDGPDWYELAEVESC